MKLSTQTILVLGFVQCIVLTLVLVFFFRYQRLLESGNPASSPGDTTESRGK